MLTICVGPNGSGKSLWALHQIVRFLMEDTRLIVTSVALNLDRLNEYLQQKMGERAPDVLRRVLVISGEQMRTFWRYRGIIPLWNDGQDEFHGIEPLVYGPFIGGLRDENGHVGPDRDRRWSMVLHGVIYVLDEIQTQFGAREWQKSGPEFLAYQSQHRKFGDDVIAIAPASALIDKQFRILAGECIALSNLYKLRIGPIKAPRKITYRVFQNCPPAPGETALANGSFSIDGLGLASCYNTAAGAGICGKDADKGKEAKGLPFYTMFIGIGLACLLVYWMFTRGMAFAMSRGVERVRVEQPGPSVVVKEFSPIPGPPTTNQNVSEGKLGVKISPETVRNVWITGMARVPGKMAMKIYLSDGQVLDFPGDSEVQNVTARSCEYRGERFEFSRR